MTPVAFALLTLAALFVVTQVVGMVFDLVEQAPRAQKLDHKIPSGIA